MSDDDIFIRQSSGLTASIGFTGAIVFGIHCISLSSSGFIPFSWVASNWPGASIVGLLAISAVVSCIHAYSFSAIGAIGRVSGADYVLASRLLSPRLAFAASWTLVLFSGVVLGGLIAWIPKSVIPALFFPLGAIFKQQWAYNFSEFAQSTQGTLAIGSIVLGISLFSVLNSNKWISRILNLGIILGVLAWALIFFQLSFATPETFRNNWDTFMGPTSDYGLFQQRVLLAEQAGMKLNRDPSIMTLAGLIMGFWIFYGYAIPTYFSGELKEGAAKWLLVPSISSIIITASVFIAAVVMLQRIVPLDWIAAEGYIANNQESVKSIVGKPVLAMPWITFYAAIAYPSFPIVITVSICWIITLFNLFQTYFFYSSRIIFAWAVDRLAPDRFADPNPRTKSPTYAILMVAALAIIGLYDASVSGPLGTQMTFAFFAVATQLITIFALLIFPFKRPDVFKSSPPFVRWKLFGMPLISVAAILTLFYLAWMIVASFLFPAVGISSPVKTLLLFGTMFFSGLFYFEVRRRYLIYKTGFDLLAVYAVRPSEVEEN
jgi:amino acid transporter